MGKSNGDRSDGADKLVKAKKRIESLKREVDRLKKELNKAKQFVQEAKNVLQEKEIDYDETPRKKKGKSLSCLDCGKGEYESFELTVGGAIRTYYTCNVCGHRKIQVEKK